MAIGGIGGALLAGLEGYSQARQQEQRNLTANREMLLRESEWRAKQAELARQITLEREGAQALLSGFGGMGGMSALPGGMPQTPPGPPMQLGGAGTMPNQPPSLVPGGAGGNWEVQHNNFGGLRRPGIIAGPRAGGFQSFDTPEAGVGAISRQLDRYASGATTGRPLTNIKDIVSTWAPPSENPTPALINRASQVTGFAPDQQLNVSDPATKAKLIEATIRNEQGGKLPVGMDVINKVANAPLAAGMTQAGANPASHAPAKEGGDIATELSQNFDPVLQNRAALQQIIQSVEKANPNASPEAKIWAVDHLYKWLAPADKMQWQFMAGMIRDQLKAGGSVLQGPSGPLFVDKQGRARAVVDAEGQPITGELSKPGTQPRNVPAMMMDQFKKDFRQLYNRDPSANEQLGWQNKVRREQSIEAAFGGGIMGRNMVSLNTLADHVAVLEDYAAALRNNDIPRANQLANRIAVESGKPEVTNFEAARVIVGDELARLLTTTGGTESDRQQMQSIMDPKAAPEQLAGAVNVMKRLVRSRLEANEQQYAGSDPARREQFQQELLSEGARKIFLSNVPTAAQPQGTPQPAPTQAVPTGGGGYTKGQVIEKGGKKYRVIGGDPNDPDVEEVQ